jgi:general secretion pathway protein K
MTHFSNYSGKVSSQRGFILVATLWVMAGLTLLAAYVDTLTDKNIERALKQRESVRGDLNRINTENTLIYLLATNRKNHLGSLLEIEQVIPDSGQEDAKTAPLNPIISLSDKTYRGLGDVRFSILDEMTLISVNSPTFPMLDSALQSNGIDNEKIRIIKARLNDYIDLDQTLSLGGAETYEYRIRKQAPPANYLLATPLELQDVLGFNELFEVAQWQSLRGDLSMRQAGGFNFNLMKPRPMMNLLNISESAVARVLTAREKAPVSSYTGLEKVLGAIVEMDDYIIHSLPSRYMRIKTWHQNSRQRYLTGVEFTPFIDQAPWRKDYYYTEQTTEPDTEKAEVPVTSLLQ